MSPSFAKLATKAGSFFSSSLWKRGFSRQRTSPSFIAAIAFSAASPIPSPANAISFLITCDNAAATGLSDSLGSRPFGRPKCASRITFPPLAESSRIVGAMRSRRVVSVTRPFSIGTLRSTRSSTRLPLTSTSSRVRNCFIGYHDYGGPRRPDSRSAEFGPPLPSGERSDFEAIRVRGAILAEDLNPSPDLLRKSTSPYGRGDSSLQLLSHRHGGVGHAVGETPLVVIPGHHPHQRAVLHLGLVHVERRGMRVVVEVDRDVGRGCVAEDAPELLLAGALHRLVDLFLVGLAQGHDLQID